MGESDISKEGLQSILSNLLDEKLQPFTDKLDKVCKEMSDLRSSVEHINHQFDMLKNKLENQEKATKEVKLENSFLKAEVLRLSGVVKSHADNLNNIEQYLRRDYLEIHGIPENSFVVEDTTSLVLQVGNLMNLELEKEDISICHRLPAKKKSTSQPRSIIVKFTRRQVREDFYRAKGQLKFKNTGDLGLTHVNHNKIFINESLSPSNQELFYKARKFKRDFGFKHVWTNSGKIYLRKDSDFDAHVIRSQDDLDKLSSHGNSYTHE